MFVDGDQVCMMCDGTYRVPSIPTLPIAAWFKVEGGKINFFHVHFDPTPFVKAKENGDLARALQAGQGWSQACRELLRDSLL